MAPTESAILHNYLLTAAQLPAVVTLEQFTALFPKSQQSSPQVRGLYRDLQRQRNAVVDAVSASIEAEVKRGRQLRREVLRARKAADGREADDEREIERALFPASAGGATRHTMMSILPELESAAEDLEAELQLLEAEEAQLLQSVQQTVGNLSDLRYGRLSNPQLRDQVIQGLHSVQETCKKKS